MSRASETTWSRRRAAVRAEAEAEKQAVERALLAEDLDKREHQSDADILQELSLQDPDQMQSGDDFAAFMRKEVPERLRRRALRTLWRSNPVLACVDELVDYGDDFKAEWNATGVIKTAYRVGKGMQAHLDEMERQRVAALAEPENPVVEEDGPEAEPLDEETEPAQEILAQSELEPEPEPQPQQIEEAPQVNVMRRMRFDFEGAA